MSTEAKAPVATPAAEAAPPSEEKKTVKKPRRVVTSETVSQGFDALQKLIEVQIEEIRKSEKTKNAPTGNKFLRTVNSKLKALKRDSMKIIEAAEKKKKKKVKAEGTTVKPKKVDGGFLKKKPITTDIAKFAGWDEKELKSRVEITKSICQYVEKHNLQDPNAKKNILLDETLKTLLRYNPEAGPLTYPRLQKFIYLFHQDTTNNPTPSL